MASYSSLFLFLDPKERLRRLFSYQSVVSKTAGNGMQEVHFADSPQKKKRSDPFHEYGKSSKVVSRKPCPYLKKIY